MQNLNYGDASSIGYFQMLTSIWNQGEYKGYGEKPHLQLKWFLDTAESVKAQRISRGLPVDDPSQYGTWVADTERPAEQYRGRYAERLAEAQELLEKSKDIAPPAAAPALPQPSDVPGHRSAQAPFLNQPAVGPQAALGDPGTAPGVVDAAGAAAAAAARSAPRRCRSLRARSASARRVRTPAPGGQVPCVGGRATRQPVVCELHHLVARAGGHKMQGGGWAAVATWVQNAEKGDEQPSGRECRGRAAGRHGRL